MQLGGLRLRASYRLILALMTAAMVGALTGVAAAAQDGPSALPAAGRADSPLAAMSVEVGPGQDGASPAAANSVSAQSQPNVDLFYETDFEQGVGLEWDSQITTNLAETSIFLGRFANDAISLSLDGLHRHSAVQLEWDLLVMDTWDGASGSDFWGFDVNGSFFNPVYEKTFHSTALLGQREDLGNIIGTPTQDFAYRSLTMTFPHISDQLLINFRGRNLQALTDESWGLDNLKVRLVNPPSVPVTIAAPPQAIAGSLFAASIETGIFSGLRSADYLVQYDPTVIAPVNVSDGEIGGVAIPVDDWSILQAGTVNITQTVPDGVSVHGAGVLAHLFFDATGAPGASTEIAFASVSSTLTHQDGDPIPAEWTGTNVVLIAGTGGAAQVAINAPPDVRVDSTFIARVDVANVENLNAADFTINFDPTVLKLVDVLGGNVGGVPFTVFAGFLSLAEVQGAGSVTILVDAPSLTGATGSGFLARLRFHVVGIGGSSSAIGFGPNRVLGNVEAEAIPAEWADSNVRITAHETADIGFDVGDTIGSGAEFLTRIDISQVIGLDSASYEIVYDPAVLRLDEVRSGVIGGAEVPVDLTNPSIQADPGPGRVAVVQDIPGNDGLTGSGYLAELVFTAIGAIGTSSGLNLESAVLSDVLGERIPTATGARTIPLVDPQPPLLCTVPEPPSHDFGEVVVGTAAGTTVELANCGEGDLTWNMESNSDWIFVSPNTGTTSIETEIITLTVDTSALAPNLRHTGRITITSNGGTLIGDVAITPREFPTDLQ